VHASASLQELSFLKEVNSPVDERATVCRLFSR
jgi:hypothetical protein